MTTAESHEYEMRNAEDVSNKTWWGLISMKELEEPTLELVQPLAETGIEDGSDVCTHGVGWDSSASTWRWRGQGIVQKWWLAMLVWESFVKSKEALGGKSPALKKWGWRGKQLAKNSSSSPSLPPQSGISAYISDSPVPLTNYLTFCLHCTWSGEV